jgi:ATP-dependent DNA helicase RecG
VPDGSPTVAGIAIVGRDPATFLPGAYVQFLRLDGDDLSAPIIDEKRITGPLPQQLRVLDEVLRANIATSVDIQSADRDILAPNYPLVALQQFVRNALMHRLYEGTAAPVRVTWFADRIEIQNPGGPYGQVTVANFGRPGVTDYRNPTIAEAMRALGYVQRFGVGIAQARATLDRNGNPEPVLEPHPENVLIIVRPRA